MKIVAPPLQTPVSTRSPGTPSLRRARCNVPGCPTASAQSSSRLHEANHLPRSRSAGSVEERLTSSKPHGRKTLWIRWLSRLFALEEVAEIDR